MRPAALLPEAIEGPPHGGPFSLRRRAALAANKASNPIPRTQAAAVTGRR